MPGQKVCLGQRVVLIRPDKEKADEVNTLKEAIDAKQSEINENKNNVYKKQKEI